MIEQVLREINNYYLIDSAWAESIEADGIISEDSEIYMAGAYVFIMGSVLNDGVYKVTAITGNKLVTEVGLQPEVIRRKFKVYLMAVPRAITDLTAEIMEYNTKNPQGIKSESLGDYSVSYGGKDETSWKSVFKSRLAPYKKVYLKLPRAGDIDDFRYR